MKRLFVLLAALVLAALAPAQRPLTMICEATFPPYEYHVRGGIDGIDPALARIVAACLGRELEVQDMAFDAVIPAVSTGKADIAASGITVTDERRRQVLFSVPYVQAAQVVVVRQGCDIASPEALRGRRIAVQSGSTGDLFVTKTFGDPERFQNVTFAITAVLSGKAEAAVVDQEPARVFVAGSQGLAILPEPAVCETYAFAFAKERRLLCAQVDAIFEAMRRQGTLERLLERYFAAGRSYKQDKAALAEALDTSDLLAEVLADEALRARLAELAATGAAAEDGEAVGAWQRFRETLHLNFVAADRWLYLLRGFGVTVEISFFAVLIGLAIGFVVAVIRATHETQGTLAVADFLCKLYLTVIRGTPAVVQLLIIYFVIFGSVNVSKVFVAVIAFGFNSGAYVSEIIRAGILSIDRGQMEAGRSLGLGYLSAMRHIILPQAFRNVLPALGNEFIVLLKETSVAGYIALMDLTKAGDIIRSQTYTAFLPLLAVAAIYLAVVSLLTCLLGLLERKLKNG